MKSLYNILEGILTANGAGLSIKKFLHNVELNEESTDKSVESLNWFNSICVKIWSKRLQMMLEYVKKESERTKKTPRAQQNTFQWVAEDIDMFKKLLPQYDIEFPSRKELGLCLYNEEIFHPKSYLKFTDKETKVYHILSTPRSKNHANFGEFFVITKDGRYDIKYTV